jgi:uncharacterized protein
MKDYYKALKKLEKFTDSELAALSKIISEGIFANKYPPITKLDLFLTADCNLRCDYCFVKKEEGNIMSWDVAKKAVDFLFRESRDVEDITIIFFGGEPLIAWDLIEKIVLYAEKHAPKLGKRTRYSITTNGVLLSEKILRFSKKHNIKHLLSLDGDRESHNTHRKFPNGEGTFDIVISKIPLLKKHQGWLGTRMTVTPETVSKLSSNVQFLFRMGINQFIIGADHDIIWDRKSIEEYERQWEAVAKFYLEMVSKGEPIRMTVFEEDCNEMKEKLSGIWGCEAGVDKVCISPRGEIYPCSRFLGIGAATGAYKLGTVEEGITARKLREDFLDHREMIRYKCMKCRYKDYCSGGCLALNYWKTGSLYHPWYVQCSFTKIHIETLRKVMGSDKGGRYVENQI